MDNIICAGHQSIIVFIFTDIIDIVFFFTTVYYSFFWGGGHHTGKRAGHSCKTTSPITPYVEPSLFLCVKMHILCRFKIRFNVIVWTHAIEKRLMSSSTFCRGTNKWWRTFRSASWEMILVITNYYIGQLLHLILQYVA